MKVKDHFLSQEIFEIKASKYDGILETYPKPRGNKLAEYYDSSEYISHQTESKSLKDLVYNLVKSLMLKRKKSWILDYCNSGKILDVGAGTGDFLNTFEDKNWAKFAIEPSPKLQNTLFKKNIAVLANLDDFDENSFDVITLWHSLEHISNLEQTLLSLKKVLKNDGVIFVAVPNYKSYDAKYYKNFWAAWDVPRHLWHFSRNGIKKIFREYSLKCEEEKGLKFDSYYVSLLSEKYKAKGIVARSFYIGYLSNLKANRNNEFSSVLYVLKPF